MTSQREAATTRAAHGDGSPRLHLVDYSTVRGLLSPLMLAPEEAQLRRWSARVRIPTMPPPYSDLMPPPHSGMMPPPSEWVL